ncbi:hypothetical protein NE237_001727 [Protea cynaroides]|uniref:U3 snoRNP-associated protein-like EMB2271 n=1 Tax=Protea cynaroides TaxID=273540 RepID=A0A9Q0KUJ2_9MAGN|nr:hypothetical protein NE237_001727 [Protea cynaroides]
MKNRVRKKKPSSLANGTNKKKSRVSLDRDPFFNHDSKRRRQKIDDDDVIDSDETDEEEERRAASDGGEEVEEVGSEFEQETADEKRQRLAKAHLEKLREIARMEQDEEELGDEELDEEEKAGNRDSLVAQMLQQEQLEESGRVRRSIASSIQKPTSVDQFQVLVRHRQPVTAIALSSDDLRGFSASKDGTIVHWDVDSGKSEKYAWPSKETLRSHGAKDPQNSSMKWSKHVLSLAVSSDGRYLATGGLDRHVHLWDTRTRDHIQAFPGHKGPVSDVHFRQGTPQLFSASFDRQIKLWNVEDRSYMQTLFGHQSEIVTIDCLRKERVLTVGRDRTMRLYKVPEESQLVFRAPMASLECACFINNEEFFSGSDDGSVQLWSLTRKKPVYIVKNAHAVFTPSEKLGATDNGITYSGDRRENGCLKPENYCLAAQSWVSSVTVCSNSDLAASGAGNGAVRLWGIESESSRIRFLFELPLVGFVNALAFAKSGRFLLAGVGQEQRLGRWGRIPAARNGVAVQSLKLSE